ncbi:MAG: tetratricopeptide repeat protein [bacterium]|nr:tetratricopeptide repeat protein [bacterium]
MVWNTGRLTSFAQHRISRSFPTAGADTGLIKPEMTQHSEATTTPIHLLGLVIVVLVVLLSPNALVLAQSDGTWESRLEAAEGAGRIALIAEYLASDEATQDTKRAIELGKEALELLGDAPNENHELAILGGLCRAQVMSETVEGNTELGRRCEDIARRLGDKRWLAWSLSWIGESNYQAGKLEEACGHFEQAAQLYKELGDVHSQAEALSSAGSYMNGFSDLTVALEHQLHARDLFESIGDLRGVGRTLLRAGLVHSELGDHDRKLDYTKQALEAFRGAGYENGQASALNNIGMYYLKIDQPQEALPYFEESLEIKRRIGEERGAARRLNNIGSTYLRLGRWDEARDFAEQAYKKNMELAYPPGVSHSLKILAKIDHAQGKFQAALESVQEAIRIIEDGGAQSELIVSYALLVELYEQLGDPAAALAALRRHNEIKSTIVNEENVQQIARMEARYRVKEQTQEIELLRREQAVQALEVEQQRNVRSALIVGFGLICLIGLLLFNRFRIRAREKLMVATVEHERQVSTQLREIDQLKDEFLANTSHELRSPLMGITGLAQAMFEDPAVELPEKIRSDLEMIHMSGRRLGSLVEDILDYSKLQRGSSGFVLAPVEIRALTDVVLTLAGPLVGDKELELVNAVESDLPGVEADEARIHQILLNLVGNAIKCSENGTITVSASVADDELVVRVTDSGRGIEPGRLERIFDSSRLDDESVRSETGGNGLGLPISKHLVELHGGRIWVESEPGCGAVFSFTLPLNRAPATIVPDVETTHRQPAAGEGREEDLSTEGASILVVDDEEVICRVLERQLVAEGHRVWTVSNGEEALAIVAEEEVDLVLLDVIMPRMSGYELCRKLREHHSLEELPILLLSGMKGEQSHVAGFEEGANDYIRKPISQDELQVRVQTHLKLLRMHRAKSEEVKILQGLLPICMHCKKIRSENDEWCQLESYIDQHSEAQFSHGVCPDCAAHHYGDLDLSSGRK